MRPQRQNWRTLRGNDGQEAAASQGILFKAFLRSRVWVGTTVVFQPVLSQSSPGCCKYHSLIQPFASVTNELSPGCEDTFTK